MTIGTKNNGTVNPGAVLTTDRFVNTNSAYSFDGSSSYIDLGSPSDLAFTNNFTLTAWCLFSGGSQNPRILSSAGGGYELITDGTGTSRSFDLLSSSLNFSTPANYTQNVWYAVAAVVQNGIGFIYVDGVLAATQSLSAFSYSHGFQIGKNSEQSTDFWGGSIDDVRLYNRALSSNEVASLYALGSQTAPPPPLTLAANLGAGPDFNLNLTGIPGQNYVLQTATNLTPPIQWLPVLTNAADTNGVWQFTDTNLNSAQKFYRVTTP